MSDEIELEHIGFEKAVNVAYVEIGSPKNEAALSKRVADLVNFELLSKKLREIVADLGDTEVHAAALEQAILYSIRDVENAKRQLDFVKNEDPWVSLLLGNVVEDELLLCKKRLAAVAITYNAMQDDK